MTTTIEPGPGKTTAKLTQWGGWALIAITTVHSISVIVIFSDQWGTILTGGLHNDSLMSRNPEAHLAYWALLGSLVPGLLVALLAIGRAREGRTMPAYVPGLLLADMIVGGWLIFPSGHVYSAIPVTLFLVDRYRSRRAIART